MINNTYCIQNQMDLSNIRFPVLIRDEKIRKGILSIIRESAEKKPYYKLMVRSEILRLLVYLFRAFGSRQLTRESKDDVIYRKLSYVKSALFFIRQNYRKPFSVDELCNYIGVSKYYLCHIFKQITGKTLVEYINYIRCEHAKKLLRSGDYNVNESAEMSGFQDPSYFTQTYKRYMGLLPSVEAKAILQ
jgi:AraC-like DNA-binding protein